MESGQRERDLTVERAILAGGYLFLLGLTACGSPSPEAPVPGQASGAAGVVLSSPAGKAADTGLSAPPVPNPGGLISDASRTTSPAPKVPAQPAASTADRASSNDKTQADQALRAARESWYAEARESPDVTMRLQALEVWAKQPNDSLDPVSYALVDEDESVRTRAQELYEQQLAREANRGQTP